MAQAPGLKDVTRRALERMRRSLALSSHREDPWERLYPIPASKAGLGSRHEFTWYLEGESSVRVSSVDELCAWLRECEYAEDRELFNEPDFWQHPSTFERLRKGDCEDHAIWAWRKLNEMGVRAELMFGTWHRGDASSGHAWVRFTDGAEEWVLESVSAPGGPMVRRLADVRDEYSPGCGVDCECHVHAYAGMWRVG